VLVLGLPLLLPATVLGWVKTWMLSLVLIAFITRAVFGRGATQAFALGASTMGIIVVSQLVVRGQPDFVIYGPYYRWSPIIGGLADLLVILLGGYVARRAFRSMQRRGELPAPPAGPSE
jgi:hypothetical protein